MNTTYEPDRGPAAQELITVVAHDLRNYLTPLQCRVDLIRRRAIREERHDYLNDSEHAARNLARLRYLIDELLDVSRLERGLFCIQPRPIDIATVVCETAEAFGGAEITIDVVTPPRV